MAVVFACKHFSFFNHQKEKGILLFNKLACLLAFFPSFPFWGIGKEKGTTWLISLGSNVPFELNREKMKLFTESFPEAKKLTFLPNPAFYGCKN